MTTTPQDWVVTALLCDYAEVADGKLFVLGGGWSLCGPGPFVHALALKLGVPWDQANRPHTLRATLHDEDANVVFFGDPQAEVAFVSDFEVGRPPGLPPGSHLDLALAVNLGPLELPPGRGYSWQISIDNCEVERVTFRTRSAA